MCIHYMLCIITQLRITALHIKLKHVHCNWEEMNHWNLKNIQLATHFELFDIIVAFKNSFKNQFGTIITLINNKNIYKV